MKNNAKIYLGSILLGLSTTIVWACVVPGTDSDCLVLDTPSNETSPNHCGDTKYPGKIKVVGIKKNVSTGSNGKTSQVDGDSCTGTWKSDGVDCTGNKFEKPKLGNANVTPSGNTCPEG